MPAHYTIDRARRLVLSYATGVFTDDDFLGHVRGLVADPDFDPSFRQVFDACAVTKMEVTGAGLRQVAKENPWKDGARRALVCDRDILFGMARMYQTLTSEGPNEVRVFREMCKALAWLGDDTIE